ncbi:hypothetical protein H4Q26_003732 [Puccinia striiformis f. sp. tritici PST-130]|nr:hypothetical protein H4Q26_003732 [Puccinia striiformis f. sp. tritici PST-130]
MTPDSVFRHHTPSEKDIQQQKIQTLPLSTKNRSTKASSTKDRPAYNSYRTARVASFDPYPTSQASQAAAKQSKAPALPKPPANKGVLPAINPPAEIAVPCGFEMWSNGGWTPKQKVRPVIDYVNWAYADAYTELQRELCEKFCGKVELVTKPNEDLT